MNPWWGRDIGGNQQRELQRDSTEHRFFKEQRELEPEFLALRNYFFNSLLEKQTSFQCLCHSYDILLICLVDTPGHLKDKETEIKPVGACMVANIKSLFQVTVPKIVIIIRKGCGLALKQSRGSYSRLLGFYSDAG